MRSPGVPQVKENPSTSCGKAMSGGCGPTPILAASVVGSVLPDGVHCKESKVLSKESYIVHVTNRTIPVSSGTVNHRLLIRFMAKKKGTLNNRTCKATQL